MLAFSVRWISSSLVTFEVSDEALVELSSGDVNEMGCLRGADMLADLSS